MSERGVMAWLDMPYRAGAALHGGLYRRGLLRQTELGCYTIAVGALHFGGAGKTPVAMELAHPGSAVLTRGYGGHLRGETRVAVGLGDDAPPWDRVLDCDGEQRTARDWSEELGDEPAMIAACRTGVPVGIGPHRRLAADSVMARFEVQRLVLDDGFSHHRVRRDLDLVCLPVTVRDGNPVLAGGPLREGIGALGRASRVVVMAEESSYIQTDKAQELMLKIGYPGPFAVAHRTARHTRRFPDGEPGAAGELKGQPAVVVCALGRPRSLHRTVRGLGASVVAHQHFPDHHRFTVAELERCERLAADSGAEAVLTSLKDAMRIPSSWRPAAPWRVLTEGLAWDPSLEDLCRREVPR